MHQVSDTRPYRCILPFRPRIVGIDPHRSQAEISLSFALGHIRQRSSAYGNIGGYLSSFPSCDLSL